MASWGDFRRAGLLDRETVDGVHLYWPAISQAELRDLLMSHVLSTGRNRVGYALTCVKRIAPTGFFMRVQPFRAEDFPGERVSEFVRRSGCPS